MSEMPRLLDADNVSIVYTSEGSGKKNAAVKEVSFAVYRGDYLCVIGMNGSGKSSLIKGILGLTPLSGGEIKRHIPKEKISYLPQISAVPEGFPATVREIAVSGTQRKGSLFISKSDREAAATALANLGISDLAERRYGALSGGQRQRVLLARAICKNPELLILDEPCAGLDEITVNQFYERLYKLNANSGTAILMITHDLHDVKRYAKHIIELDTRLLFWGTVGEWEQHGSESSHIEHTHRHVAD
ncbi:zinc uptake system ATP-binding protein ZurA [Clostridia bacterium]|nr:zinc uptake system ATP-binding protein ZurA [Clostridia bacterium]